MTDNLFDLKPQDQERLDQNKNYLEELVGEGKKFKDVQSLAYGKAEADLYVKHLEARLDEMRTDREKLENEYKAGKSLDEYIQELKTMGARQPQHLDGNNPPPEVKNPPALQPEQFQTLFSEAYEKQQQLNKARQNLASVQEKLTEKFGANAASILEQKVKALGLTKARAQELAQESDVAFFKLLDLDVKQDGDFQAPPRSTQRNDPFTPNTKIRDWAYYEKMRVENPKLYHNPKTHVQMHKDANDIDAQYGAGTFMRHNRLMA